MSGPADGGGLSESDRKALQQRASELGRKLDKAEAPGAKPSLVADDAKASRDAGRGLQMALDLVLGPVIGAGLGWGIDRVLGTAPWMLLVFLALGAAAGITSLIRTYRRIMAESGGTIGKDLPAGQDGDDE